MLWLLRSALLVVALNQKNRVTMCSLFLVVAISASKLVIKPTKALSRNPTIIADSLESVIYAALKVIEKPIAGRSRYKELDLGDQRRSLD